MIEWIRGNIKSKGGVSGDTRMDKGKSKGGR